MSSFEERLNRLEGKVNTHDALLSSNSNALLTHTIAPPASSPYKPIEIANPISSNEIILQEETQEDMLTDGMAITFVSEDDSGFFGAWLRL
jgi:hypothetical protein